MLCSIALLIGLSAAPQAASATPLTSKGAPPLPTIGERDRVNAPLPTGAVAEQAQRKNEANAAAFANIQRSWASAAKAPAGAQVALAVPTAKTLPVSYQVQQTGYWCGPTTLAVVLGYKGLGWGGTAYQQQSAAASLLGTTTNGTAWYGSDHVPAYPGSSWYPMQDALNYKLYSAGWDFSYAVMGLPNSPSASDEAYYKSNLVVDIATYNFPFAANEYAVSGSQIGKQPSGQTIMHWVAPNGYDQSGAITIFEDPGWGAGSASHDWSTRVVAALGGRGYVA